MGTDVIIINLILALPTFFLCKFLSRKIKAERTRQIAIWSATLLFTPIVYVALIVGWISYARYYPERAFDKEVWKTEVETRYELTDDLIDNKKLIGKTKEEIIELLGQEGVSMDSSLWTYYIGFKRGSGIDPDVLEIEFKNGKVAKCWTRGT